MGIFTTPKIAVGTHFHEYHGTKSSPIFLHIDGKASWLQPPRLVSLLSAGMVQLQIQLHTYPFLYPQGLEGQVLEGRNG